MSAPFSAKAAVREGWVMAKPHLLFLAVSGLVFYALGALFSYAGTQLTAAVGAAEVEGISWPVCLCGLVGSIVLLGIYLGQVRAALRIARGAVPQWSDLLGGYRKLGQGVASTCLFFLWVGLGLVLFVVPGVIWSIEYSLYLFAIIDEGLGPVAALKRSATLTRGARGELALFYTLTFFIYLPTVINILSGPFLTVPPWLIIAAQIYEIVIGPIVIVMTARFYEVLRLHAEETAAPFK